MVAAARLRFGPGCPRDDSLDYSPRLPLIRTCPLGHKARHVMSSLRDGTLSGSQPVVETDTAPAVGSIDPGNGTPTATPRKPFPPDASHKPSVTNHRRAARTSCSGNSGKDKRQAARTCTADRTRAEAVAATLGGQAVETWGSSCKDMHSRAARKLQGHAQQIVLTPRRSPLLYVAKL